MTAMFPNGPQFPFTAQFRHFDHEVRVSDLLSFLEDMVEEGSDPYLRTQDAGEGVTRFHLFVHSTGTADSVLVLSNPAISEYENDEEGLYVLAMNEAIEESEPESDE